MSTRARFEVEPICSTSSGSASAYYQRASGQRWARALEDQRLLKGIEQVHANYRADGYPRIWKALLGAGEPDSRDHVKRLMPDAAHHDR